MATQLASWEHFCLQALSDCASGLALRDSGSLSLQYPPAPALQSSNGMCARPSGSAQHSDAGYIPGFKHRGPVFQRRGRGRDRARTGTTLPNTRLQRARAALGWRPGRRKATERACALTLGPNAVRLEQQQEGGERQAAPPARPPRATPRLARRRVHEVVKVHLVSRARGARVLGAWHALAGTRRVDEFTSTPRAHTRRASCGAVVGPLGLGGVL